MENKGKSTLSQGVFVTLGVIASIIAVVMSFAAETGLDMAKGVLLLIVTVLYTASVSSD
jgi:multisubunit Na+/H+ antiporter MnhG subunit